MPVNTVHPSYTAYAEVWQTTRDAAGGDAKVKAKANQYLKTDFMDTESERFDVYKSRAYFMGVTGRTEKAMIGMVFRRPAIFELPSIIEPYLEDFDGSGNSIEQIAKDAMSGLLETRRHVFLVDYPEAPEGIDAATERAIGLRPTVAQYSAEALINWRFEGVKGKSQLVLAVLKEQVNTSGDEFGHDFEPIYRVLRLRDGVYTQQVFDEGLKPLTDEFAPKMAGGATFDHIPLHGVRELEEPPLFSIAKVNLAHYRNIADLEDAAYTVGQPMVHVNIGETSPETWSEQNTGGIQFGSRKGIITQKGSVELVQASENNLIRDIKNDKQEEMVSLGAQLITRGGQAETAEAARINAGAETSVLDMLVNDLSEDLEDCIKDMCLFVGANADEVSYQLNTDYFDSGLSPQALMAVIQGVTNSIYTQGDALHMIKTGRIELEQGRDIGQIEQETATNLIDEDFTNLDSGES